MYHHKDYTPYQDGNLSYYVRSCSGAPVCNPTFDGAASCSNSMTLCNQSVAVSLNVPCTNATYTWEFDPAYLSSNGSLSPYGSTCYISNWGFIRVKATASNQFGTSQATFYFYSCQQMNYAVYPNPSKDELNISFGDEKSANALVENISLIDKNGRTVRTFENSNNEILDHKGTSFNTNGLAKGMYFLHIKVGKEVKKEQILIE
jgi:hypothetical protein